MPGRKLTMLPDAVVDAFTLAEMRDSPALSLYVVTNADGAPLRQRTALERVPIAANLRHDALTEAFATDAGFGEESPWTPELRALWKLAMRLSDLRGKADISRIDYNFDVDRSVEGAGEPGRVAITPRTRGNPLDKLVAELLIHVNHTWGRRPDDAQMPGRYRGQSGSQVKVSTLPGHPQRLGFTRYRAAGS